MEKISWFFNPKRWRETRHLFNSSLPGSGATKAGIRKSDILVSLAGEAVKNMRDLDSVKRKFKAGDTVDAEVIRKGISKTLKLTFSEER